MRVLLALLCSCLAGCTGSNPPEDACFVVRSFSSEPLGYEFMKAEPVPVSVSDKGLKELLDLAPPTARKYATFCATIYSDGRFVLTPNTSLPKEAFVFSRDSNKWKFLKTEEIFYLQ